MMNISARCGLEDPHKCGQEPLPSIHFIFLFILLRLEWHTVRLVDLGRVIGNEIVSLLSNLVTNVLIGVHNYYARSCKISCDF